MKSGKGVFLGVIIFFLGVHLILAQPSVQFSLPEKACKGELFTPTNTSDINLQHDWEFCYGGLHQAPTFQNSVINNLAIAPDGLVVVEDNGSWFGFVVGTNSHNLIRLDFGNSLANNPSLIDLGNPAGSLLRPRDIALIKYNGNWFAFIANYDQVSGTAKVVRFDFGSSITNSPIATNLGDFSGRLSQPFSIKLKIDAGNLIALIGDRSQRKILLVNFKTTPNIIPSAGSAFLELSLPASGFLGDFDIIRFGGDWYGLTISENGAVQKLKFLNQLFSIPQVTILTDQLTTINSPSNIIFLRDIDNFVVLLTEFGGNVIRLNFGNTPDTLEPEFTNLGNGGVLANNSGFSFLKIENQWIGYTHNTGSGRLNRIVFQENCYANQPSSTLYEPSVSYTTDGVKVLSLELTSSVGEKQYKIDSILIKRDPLPEFNFVYNCTDQQTLFSDGSISDGEIISWEWNFGDPSSGGNNTSTTQNSEHMFNVADTYSVQLEVVDDCAISTNITKSVIVNDATVIDLSIQSLAEICSFQFIDVSPETSLGLSAVREPNWTFGDGESSLLLQPTHQYTADGNFQLMLSAVVSECKKSTQKTIAVKPGNNITFSTEGICEGVSTSFTLESSGSPITNVLWSFGDGTTSGIANPNHIYGAGDFLAEVEVTNSMNCVNTTSRPISIYSKPQVNFAAALPPFSCNGTPTMFSDLTPNPVDSNIDSWLWNFGDSGSGQNTSTLKNPQHTYITAGNYDVSLTVSTNFLCSSTLQLPVTISQAPVADFNFTPPCEDVIVNFTDTSLGVIQSWNWQIGSTFYFIQNPAHTFSNPVSTNATLNVTATNNCIGSITKPIIVPAKLIPDFSVLKNCTGQETLFTDITNPAADPITNRDWNFNNLGTGAGSPETFTFTTTGNKNVTLTLTTQTGCIYAVTKAVNIISSPQANFTASPEAGAPPLEVQFANTSVGATSYLWSFNDSEGTTSNQVSPSFTYQDLGEYVIDLTAFNAQNCSHTFSRAISVVLPVIDVALIGLELMEFPDGSIKPAVTIFNHGNTPLSNLGLLIDVSGPVIREYVSTTILPGASYRHVLEIDIPDPDQLDYLCIEADIEDISPQDNQVCQNIEKIFITLPPYPNPANGELHIDWILNEDGVVNISLINSMGQTVEDFSVNSSEGLNPITLETAGMSSGVYLIRLDYKSSTRVYKVFIAE